MARDRIASLDDRLRDYPLRLGFGTAWLPKDRAAAQALLRHAADNGVRYIDTARMYGSGAAEAVVGEALRAMPPATRERMIIATKLGIVPQSGGLPARLARKLAQRFAMTPPDFARPRFGAFAADDMAASLDTSLRALGVDRVDVLLLHEVAPGHLRDETLHFLENARHAGKFARLGIATGKAETAAILAGFPDLVEIVQIADSAWQPNRASFAGRQTFITHSLLIDGFAALRARLANDDACRREWSEALDFDAAEPGALAGMFVRYALAANPDGLVLFSTTNPGHLRDNVRWAAKGPLDDALCERLRELVAS